MGDAIYMKTNEKSEEAVFVHKLEDCITNNRYRVHRVYDTSGYPYTHYVDMTSIPEDSRHYNFSKFLEISRDAFEILVSNGYNGFFKIQPDGMIGVYDWHG